MLTLALLRHAKSAWDDLDLDDHDRPLAARGIKAAPLMGRYLAREKLKPELILCSDAVRARATLALVLPELGSPPPEIRYEPALYLASPDTIVEVLVKSAGKAQHVMIVGHNPGLHALALSLSGGGDRAALGELAAGFPTAALALLTFELKTWKDVKPAGGRLQLFVSPRSLKT
jgi:phosphohistidine phosphatase